ncbi:MAG: TraR/DksA C4-type zinc finger protein [Alphaproteobacteria bacterium]
MKVRLLEVRAGLVDTSKTSADSRRPVELDQSRVGRVSRMDALQDQAMAVESERRRGVEITRIDAALARIEGGDYGYCLVCEDDIEAKRLEFDPATPVCITCARGRG